MKHPADRWTSIAGGIQGALMRLGLLWCVLPLIFLFVILRLNPGDHISTSVTQWPWFAWWGASVLWPLVLWCYLSATFLIMIALVGTALEYWRPR